MADEITNTKYITFNAAEFKAFAEADAHWWGHVIRPQLSGHDTPDPPPTPAALPDAVVIRRRDIFAGPGLHAYAMAIQTAIDLAHTSGFNPSPGLEELRDFFATQAQLAVEDPNKHLPD